MKGIRFMFVGVLVTLIIFGTAASPVYARMGGSSGSGDSGVILSQIQDIVVKYNGNHSDLMQAFSGEFGNSFYIIVKKGFWSWSKYVYKADIDSQGYVTITEVTSSSGGMGMGRHGGGGGSGYDCNSNTCMMVTEDDLGDAYEYLMANTNDYITLDDVYGLSADLFSTWALNAGIFDDITLWIVDEYL